MASSNYRAVILQQQIACYSNCTVKYPLINFPSLSNFYHLVQLNAFQEHLFHNLRHKVKQIKQSAAACTHQHKPTLAAPLKAAQYLQLDTSGMDSIKSRHLMTQETIASTLNYTTASIVNYSKGSAHKIRSIRLLMETESLQ